MPAALALVLVLAASHAPVTKKKPPAPATPAAAPSAVDAASAKAAAKSLGVSADMANRVEKYARDADAVAKGGQDGAMCALLDAAISLGGDLHGVVPAGADPAVLVRAESPGFGPDEVSVEATRDRLVLRGRKQQEHEEHDRGFHRIERQAGEFFRSVILPSEVDPDRATATFRDGVLHVSLPKTEEARARQVRVPVRSS